MAKHVFLSFVVEDLELVKMFRGQAKNKNSDLSFDDYSVTTPFNSTDAAYIRGQIAQKINAASVTICLIGTRTAGSQWVKWEIEKSLSLGKRVLGVRLHSDPAKDVAPSALGLAGVKVVNWNIDDIVKFINES